jgi:drug/metabolite transporter (DMT)-like permease
MIVKMGKYVGLFYVLCASIMFGSAFTLAKEPLRSINSLTLSSLVYLISGLCLLPTILRSPIRISRKKDIGTLVIIAILGAAVAPLLLFLGLEQTEPTDAAILINGEIIFTVIFAWLLFGEWSKDVRTIFSMILVVVGLGLATTDLRISETLFQYKPGNLMILMATVCWALDNNISRRFLQSTNIGPASLAMVKSLLGGSILLAATVLTGRVDFVFPTSLWPQIVFLAAFAFGYALLFFLKGLRKIGTVKTMMVFSMTPIFGIIITVIVTGSYISYLQIIATGMIIFGIILISKTIQE